MAAETFKLYVFFRSKHAAKAMIINWWLSGGR